MKRAFTLLLAACLSLTAARAQTALDFTFTDTHGNVHNLQNALNQGYIVMVDFFFVNCPPCQGTMPELVSISNDYAGKNVILWSISDRDGNAAIDNFKQTYDATFPAGGTAGNGDDVVNLYANAFNFTGFPTISIICPDGGISWDIWPYTAGAPQWRNAIEACGVVDAAPYQPVNATAVTSIGALDAATLAPNPATDISSLTLELREGEFLSIDVMSATGTVVQRVFSGRLPAGQHKFDADLEQLPQGMYWVRLQNEAGDTRTLPLQKI